MTKYWIQYIDTEGMEHQGVYGEVDYKTYFEDKSNVLAVYKGEQHQVDLLLLLKDGHISPSVRKSETERVLKFMERIR
jgi:hypothetical protein